MTSSGTSPRQSTMKTCFLPTPFTKILTTSVCVLIIALNAFLVPPCQAKNTPPTITLSFILAQGKTLSVSESTPVKSLLGLLEISDHDTGPAGDVSCRSESNYIGLQEISKNHYKVIIQNALDREESNFVDVLFLCTDHGSPPMSQSETFAIEVNDANDNKPKFTQEAYTFTVMENDEPNKEVGEVQAYDLDLGENSVVSYYLTDAHGKISTDFKIDDTSGIITCTSSMDREKVDEIILYVYSEDHGEPPLKDEAEVRVKIIDANDNSPKIITRNFSINENLQSFSHVGTLKAEDADDGSNGEVEFSLDFDGRSSAPFIVQSDGEIYAAVPLDRERRDTYTIQVVATDLGAPSLSTKADITITVNDANDNTPIIVAPKGFDEFDLGNSINSSELVSIDWYSPMDTKVVYQVSAVDNDINDNGRLYYTIESINSQPVGDDSLFEIKEETGQVFLRRLVRSDDDPVQVLSFLVYDGGYPSLNATASMNVTLDVDFSSLTPPPATESSISQEGPTGSAIPANIGFLMCVYGFCLFYFGYYILNRWFIV